MARVGGGILHRLLRSCAARGRLAGGGLIVHWTILFASIVVIVLVVYLTAALLVPEKFS